MSTFEDQRSVLRSKQVKPSWPDGSAQDWGNYAHSRACTVGEGDWRDNDPNIISLLVKILTSKKTEIRKGGKVAFEMKGVAYS